MHVWNLGGDVIKSRVGTSCIRNCHPTLCSGKRLNYEKKHNSKSTVSINLKLWKNAISITKIEESNDEQHVYYFSIWIRNVHCSFVGFLAHSIFFRSKNVHPFLSHFVSVYYFKQKVFFLLHFGDCCETRAEKIIKHSREMCVLDSVKMMTHDIGLILLNP